MTVFIPLIVFALTIYLCLRRQSDYLIAWLCLLLCVDIFDSQVWLNLSSVKTASLAMLLTSWKVPWFRLIKRSLFLRLFAIYILLLAVLGIYYGYLAPVELDSQLDLARFSSRDLPPWRVVLHLASYLLEMHFAFRLGHAINSTGSKGAEWLKRGLLVGFGLVCLGAILEKISGFDFYHFFTGGRALHNPDRMRGFSYEPRGLSQACAYGLLLLPLMLKERKAQLLMGLALFISGFIISGSMTGIITLVAGAAVLFVSWQFISRRSLRSALKPAMFLSIGILALIGITVFGSNLKTSEENHYLKRRYLISPDGDFASRLEVFDAATANFFQHHPSKILLGTGPGLVYLSASKYVVAKDREFWSGGFTALPHMGILLIIANAGLIGFFLFTATVAAGFTSARYKFKHSDIYYIMFVALYLLQIRPFYVLIGALAFPSDGDSGPSPDTNDLSTT